MEALKCQWASGVMSASKSLPTDHQDHRGQTITSAGIIRNSPTKRGSERLSTLAETHPVVSTSISITISTRNAAKLKRFQNNTGQSHTRSGRRWKRSREARIQVIWSKEHSIYWSRSLRDQSCSLVKTCFMPLLSLWQSMTRWDSLLTLVQIPPHSVALVACSHKQDNVSKLLGCYEMQVNVAWSTNHSWCCATLTQRVCMLVREAEGRYRGNWSMLVIEWEHSGWLISNL